MLTPELQAALQNAAQNLSSSPAARAQLAAQIQAAGLSEKIPPPGSSQDLPSWIAAHPDLAAKISVGLSQDRALGGDGFQQALNHATLHYNEEAVRRGLLGRLARQDDMLKRMRLDSSMKKEERLHYIKNIFEGPGGESQKILSRRVPGGPGGGAPGFAGGTAPPVLAPVPWERSLDTLAPGRLTGYSPQILYLQSALKSGAPPGAPKLVPTGRLDYETLVYPSYSLNYDLARLEKNLDEYAKDAKERRRRRAAPGPDADLILRAQDALKKARAAIDAFESAARPARDSSRITRRLLETLSSEHAEASRWIAVLWLEEDLLRLRARGRFMTPELSSGISSLGGFPPSATRGYLAAGRIIEAEASAMAREESGELAALLSPSWHPALKKLRKNVPGIIGREKTLDSRIAYYVRIPYGLAALSEPKPWWERWLDRAALRLFPGSPRAKRLGYLRARRAALEADFNAVAAGKPLGG